MKAVILAGGMGTRLSEETTLRPKPMTEIGGKPLLWHIMKIYSHHGFNDFIICLGYKGYVIKEYFYNYYMHQSDLTIDLATNELEFHNPKAENWRVSLVDTGQHTMTGGRIKRLEPLLGDGTFLLTYGDGVADVDLNALVAFHRARGRLATLTAVQPVGKFGAVEMSAAGLVSNFREKPKGDRGWISGGFFVLEPEIFRYIEGGDLAVWEKHPLEGLARDRQLAAYRHQGFWHAVDNLRDKMELEAIWDSGSPPWKVWEPDRLSAITGRAH
jgi:glucose-1-phosphate cytidylyltransferase